MKGKVSQLREAVFYQRGPDRSSKTDRSNDKDFQGARSDLSTQNYVKSNALDLNSLPSRGGAYEGRMVVDPRRHQSEA